MTDEQIFDIIRSDGVWGRVPWKLKIGSWVSMATFTQFAQLEFKLLDWLTSTFHSDFLDLAMPYVSSLGNGGAIWILIAAVLLIKKETRKTALSVILSLLFSVFVANIILKPWIARLRPYELNPSIKLLIPPPSGFSFPSGHTQSSFAAASVLRRNYKWLGAAAMGLAILIGFSRLYLSVHFITDVVGGAVIGYCLGLIANGIISSMRYRYNAKRRKQKKRPS